MAWCRKTLFGGVAKIIILHQHLCRGKRCQQWIGWTQRRRRENPSQRRDLRKQELVSGYWSSESRPEPQFDEKQPDKSRFVFKLIRIAPNYYVVIFHGLLFEWHWNCTPVAIVRQFVRQYNLKEPLLLRVWYIYFLFVLFQPSRQQLLRSPAGSRFFASL